MTSQLRDRIKMQMLLFTKAFVQVSLTMTVVIKRFIFLFNCVCVCVQESALLEEARRGHQALELPDVELGTKLRCFGSYYELLSPELSFQLHYNSFLKHKNTPFIRK